MQKLKKLSTAITSAATTALITAMPVQAQLGDVRPQKGYATNIGTLLSSLLNLVMIIAAILVFLYLVWGGIEWITSGGDKSKTEGARNKITAAVVGLIVLAASYAVLQLALNFLGFDQGINSVFNNWGDINNPAQ
jgi:hypothetical protein